MYLTLFELLLWLQPEASAGASASGGGGTSSASSGIMGCAGGSSQLGFIAIMFLVFWFLIIQPQRKQQKAQEAMLKALAKGQSVRTTGGVLGEILEIDERQVTLKIADKTKINVLRSHIAGLEGSTVDASAKDKP